MLASIASKASVLFSHFLFISLSKKGWNNRHNRIVQHIITQSHNGSSGLKTFLNVACLLKLKGESRQTFLPLHSLSDLGRTAKGNLAWLCSVIRLCGALLTPMCSNSRPVSTLTDWLMILSREELALSADSSLPCGSHCLQRSTKDLEDKHRHEAPLSVMPSSECFAFVGCVLYLRGGQQLTRAMVLETYPSPLSPNSACVS